MARPRLLRRPREHEAAARGDGTAPRSVRRPLPPPSELRRERRALTRLREERIRDLGGIVLEMYRRDSFRESLLYEQCAEIASMEERLRELDVLLEGRRAPAARCECGAPLLLGSHFCANCGRPARRGAAAACGACGHTLAADARFCPACGTAADAADDAAPPDA